jgi:PAS domain-containing protein
MSADNFSGLGASSVLRQVARERLASARQHGMGTTVGVSALVLLQSWIGDPERVSDALRVLHELRVHQEEIGLQNEELERLRQAAGDERDEAHGWFDASPVPLLCVDADGSLVRANKLAAEWFRGEIDVRDQSAPVSSSQLVHSQTGTINPATVSNDAGAPGAPGQNLLQRWPASMRAPMRHLIRRALDGHTAEGRMPASSGGMPPLHWRAAPAPRREGQGGQVLLAFWPQDAASVVG